MSLKVVIVALAVASTVAFPADIKSDAGQTPIPIVSQSNDINGNGNFTYSYETGNGIKLQQLGFVKPAPPSNKKVTTQDGDEDQPTEIQVINGSYSYTAPDGTAIELQYTADENGFHPQGAHLPTAPPVPPEIQKMLDSLPSSTVAPSTK